MLFNSYVFLIFLPVVWTGYFLLNRLHRFKAALGFLAAASFVFYGYGDYRLCFLLAFSIVANYLLHLGLTKTDEAAAETAGRQDEAEPEVAAAGRTETRNVRGKLLLAVGLLVNFGLLFYFKYYDFAIENLNRLHFIHLSLKNIALPLGISFYTFQQVSFVIDSYKKKTERYSFLEYCVFVSFFAQLVAGPIVLHQEMVPQLREPTNKKIHYGNLLKGMQYFVIGFAKKVVVADRFALAVNAGFDGIAQLNSFSAILTILAYTLEIYFDFSGYCDMALGIGYLFNIKLPINFDSPYKALSITEFWKRWHITLNRFLTTYLYFPLGGSRKGLLRTCVNIMIVFAASGLWHGAAWTFVVWGLLHGIVRVVDKLVGKYIQKLPSAVRWLGTFLFVNFAWVFFRAEFLRQPLRLFRQVLSGGGGGAACGIVSAFWDHTIWQSTLERICSVQAVGVIGQVYTVLWFAFWTVVCVRFPSSHEIVQKDIRKTGFFVAVAVVFAYAFLGLSQISEFIYFNF